MLKQGIKCAIILFIIHANVGFAQTDAIYKQRLKIMFEVSGTEETYRVGIKQMIKMFKEQKPKVPATVWSDLENEFLKTSLNDLVDLLAPVYSKHLTVDELNKVIEFYQTPVGLKFAQKNPIIMQESMKVGQEWGMRIGMKLEDKLRQKGY